jgi:hypothetical protein
VEVAATELEIQRCGSGSCGEGGDGVDREEGRLVMKLTAMAAVPPPIRASLARRARDSGGRRGNAPRLVEVRHVSRGKEVGQA